MRMVAAGGKQKSGVAPGQAQRFLAALVAGAGHHQLHHARRPGPFQYLRQILRPLQRQHQRQRLLQHLRQIVGKRFVGQVGADIDEIHRLIIYTRRKGGNTGNPGANDIV